MSFTSIHAATAEQWERIYRTQDSPKRREREYLWAVRLLRACGEIRDEFSISQLGHCLQVATRAEQAGADEELILAGLVHDIAKPLSLLHHPRIGAEMLREYVSPSTYAVLLHHGEFLSDITHHTDRRSAFRSCPWFGAACRFAEWDAASFDPHYPTRPLVHFMPRLMRLYRLDGAALTLPLGDPHR
jgi:predicted HD phosphohydrolase